MRVFQLSLLAVLAQLATLCMAAPLTLTPRSERCSNAPNTVAGTLLERGQSAAWCAPNSKTWVIIDFGSQLVGTFATDLLIDSFNVLGETMRDMGDGPLLRGLFEFKRYGLVFSANNANNHQLTRAVLEAAITAVWQCVRNQQAQNAGQGTLTFLIYDGVNQVGAGSLQPVPKG